MRNSIDKTHLSLLPVSAQLFQTSRSPARDMRPRGHKVIIAKPGSYHRPSHTVGLVIGGHRYWQGQTAPTSSSHLRVETRSGRSPRRRSPGYRKTDRASPQPPANLSGFLGVPLAKLSSFRNLKMRGGANQKKVPQNNKAVR